MKQINSTKNKLEEKLDFSFKIKDFELVTTLFEEYFNERCSMYETLFLTNEMVSDLEAKQYIDYFITPCLEESVQHPNLYRIVHFIYRNYEFYTLPEVYEIIDRLKYIFDTDPSDLSLIIESEADILEELRNLWASLYEAVSNYPILNLDSFEYLKLENTQVYYEKDYDAFTLDCFKKFVTQMQEEFPVNMRRIDTFILAEPDYIDFVAGEGTMAYYLDDTVYMPCKVKEEDKVFFVETLYHEFFHFLFESLSEEYQILWYDCYNTWIKNNVEMTREKGKNEVEELFADVGSYIYCDLHDVIHKPSEMIIEQFKSIIKTDFDK